MAKDKNIPQNVNTNPENQPSYYVGIGASAGGLEALEDFFIHAPKDTGMAFIIVQHLSPDYKSMMVELLARKTNMKVVQITDGMHPEANCIHLIPPQKNLTIFHSQLVLTEQIRGASLNLPIDIFFRSLALDKGKRAVGIILSGTGSDGSLGIKAIKEQGGLIMVQDYSSAKFDGMPKSAIATGMVDYILDTKIMCETLVKHINHPKISMANIADEDENKEETSYVKILSLIRSNTDIDFAYYKPKTILRRIERRISINQLENF
jgi:two-component system CheB/CheR fusion protein